jgi:Cys-tRNA(Pro) deacylase
MLGAEDLKKFVERQDIAGRVIHLEVPTPTVEAAAEAVGTTPARIVKSLLFVVEGKPVLVIGSGDVRIDKKRLAAHFGVGKRRVKLADHETVEKITGYDVGGVPPFGHRRSADILIDRHVFEQDVIYAGGGSVNALLEISPGELLRVTQATVLDLQ